MNSAMGEASIEHLTPVFVSARIGDERAGLRPGALSAEDIDVLRGAQDTEQAMKTFHRVGVSEHRSHSKPGAETFDVLLSDLQMPNAGDGLTVVSAMRHSNTKAVTLILSGYPEMRAAAAILVTDR
jgi:CheY-like chemotaxis protein